MELFDLEWYPDLRSYTEEDDWKEIVLEGAGDVDQVIETTSRPLYTFALGYSDRDINIVNAVRAFRQRMRGAATKFYFYSSIYSGYYTGMTCVLGGSHNITYYAPMRLDASRAPSVYRNGVLVNAADYSLGTYETASPYRSIILFDSAVIPSTDVITCSGYGQRLFICRFTKNALSVSPIDTGYAFNFKLKTAGWI